MKKAVKSAALLVVMAMLVAVLAGCGSDKLVATKSTQDETMGSYTEEITITFKDNKASSVEMAMVFDNEETANTMYSLYNLGMSMSEDEEAQGMDVKLDGKKLVITADAATFLGDESVSDEELTKDAIKAELEADGYTVK